MQEKKENNQKIENQKTKKCYCNSKTKKIIAIIFAIIIILCLGIYAKNWKQTKDMKVSLGLSSPDFPYRDYTEEELNKMYPQIRNADVPTRTSPEETYANFRQALKENNFEMAIEQLDKGSRRYEDNVNDLKEAYQQNRFESIYEAYPVEIIKENMYESIAQYYFNYKENNEDKTHFINFTKDVNGDWKLDSL